MGINYCNVTPFLYRILSFQNIICNNFVSNGRGREEHRPKTLFFLGNATTIEIECANLIVEKFCEGGYGDRCQERPAKGRINRDL